MSVIDEARAAGEMKHLKIPPKTKCICGHRREVHYPGTYFCSGKNGECRCPRFRRADRAGGK